MIKKEIKEKTIQAVNKVTGVDLKEKTRKFRIVEARMLYYKILKQKGYTLTEIANTLNKNHATVLHSLRVFDDIFEYDKDLQNKYKKAYSIANNTKEEEALIKEDVDRLTKELEKYQKNPLLNKIATLLEIRPEEEKRFINLLNKVRNE